MYFSKGSQAVVRRPVLNNNRHVEVGAATSAAGNEQHYQQQRHHQHQHQQELRGRSRKPHNVKGQGQQSKLITRILTYRSIVQWLALFIVIMSISSLMLHSTIMSHHQGTPRAISTANTMLFWTAFPSFRIRIMYPKSILFSFTGHDDHRPSLSNHGRDLSPKLPFFRHIGYPDFGGLHITQFKMHIQKRHAAAVDARRQRRDRNLHPQYHRRHHKVDNGERDRDYHQHGPRYHNHETPTGATKPDDNEPAPRREILPDPLASQMDPSVTRGYDDDDAQRGRPNEESSEDCRPVSWDQTIYPTCNSFHEFDFTGQALEGHAKYVGGGSYRIVFSAQMPTGEPVIFKEYPMEGTLGAKSLDYSRLDGSVGAYLQPHPRFVDMYGWCALSMFSEHMRNGDLVKYATPKFDRCDRFDVSKNYTDLTVSTKLRWSLQMAEAIAVLHNNPGGVFVHNDIWLAQFLVSDDGQNIKINDYNLGKIMHFDQEKGEYCKYRNHLDYGDWRPWEQYMHAPGDNKIDIWSLSMNIYSILTGLVPYHTECEYDDVQKRVFLGDKPFIDPRWASLSSPGEAALADLLHQCCWHRNPEKRWPIEEIVLRLRAIVQEHNDEDDGSGGHYNVAAA